MRNAETGWEASQFSPIPLRHHLCVRYGRCFLISSYLCFSVLLQLASLKLMQSPLKMGERTNDTRTKGSSLAWLGSVAKTMHIEAVLFDADGVIQRPLETRRNKLGEVLGSSRDVGEFLTDVSALEQTALEGQSNFTEALSKLLSRWKCPGTLGDFLDAWTMIEVAPGIADTIGILKRNGVACYLATNQVPYRARYMSEALGYRDLFDREFYSCHIGMKKPDGAYFRAILDVIGVPPSRVLFLDDHRVNVDSAREEGLHAAVFSLEAGLGALHRILEEFGIRAAPDEAG